MKGKWAEMYEKASEEVTSWRRGQKKATLTEIETNVDEQLAKVRARMVEDLAMESELADIKGVKKEQRPKCPKCEKVMQANGKQKRRIVTEYEQTIELERSHAKCAECGHNFFPSG